MWVWKVGRVGWDVLVNGVGRFGGAVLEVGSFLEYLMELRGLTAIGTIYG
jgi:hypothetical protein